MKTNYSSPFEFLKDNFGVDPKKLARYASEECRNGLIVTTLTHPKGVEGYVVLAPGTKPRAAIEDLDKQTTRYKGSGHAITLTALMDPWAGFAWTRRAPAANKKVGVAK